MFWKWPVNTINPTLSFIDTSILCYNDTCLNLWLIENCSYYSSEPYDFWYFIFNMPNIWLSMFSTDTDSRYLPADLIFQSRFPGLFWALYHRSLKEIYCIQVKQQITSSIITTSIICIFCNQFFIVRTFRLRLLDEQGLFGA